MNNTTLYQRLGTGLFLGLFAIITTLFAPLWFFITIIGALSSIIIIYEWPRLFDYKKPAFWLIMPFYILCPLGLLVLMQLQGDEYATLLTFCLVGAHDVGSYMVGKAWGIHKIHTGISPRKTWEGFFGGVALTFLFSLIFFGKNSPSTLLLVLLPFVILVCFAALGGDLFESTLKRYAGIKDSGDILPGHGGLLDRIDGLLFVTIIIYITRDYLKALVTF
jgi:phosphatidate cytidylyltransferase